jgi:hypothetical protein
MEAIKANSKIAHWTGRIISVLCVLFFFFDAITKIIRAAPAMEGSIQIGWPREMVQGIGIVLLACSILYLIPRTPILGAILLTGYLEGAASIMMRAGMLGHPYFFPIVFGILIWAGLFMRDESLRPFIPLKIKNNKQ